MGVIDIIKVVLTLVVAWFVIVFLFYFLLVRIAGHRNAGLLARALYSVYLVLMFLYAVLYSPFTRYVRVWSVGFYIAIAILILLLVFVIVSGLAGKTVKRGGGADA